MLAEDREILARYLPRPDELDPALPSPSRPQDINPQFKSEDSGDDIAD
jgi:hypothetical protein